MRERGRIPSTAACSHGSRGGVGQLNPACSLELFREAAKYQNPARIAISGRQTGCSIFLQRTDKRL